MDVPTAVVVGEVVVGRPLSHCGGCREVVTTVGRNLKDYLDVANG